MNSSHWCSGVYLCAVAKRCVPAIDNITVVLVDSAGVAIKTAKDTQLTAGLLAKAISYLGQFYQTKQVTAMSQQATLEH